MQCWPYIAPRLMSQIELQQLRGFNMSELERMSFITQLAVQIDNNQAHISGHYGLERKSHL